MFDLSKIKCVLFDFDDTLGIHSNHNLEFYNSPDFTSLVKSGKYYWDDCSPNIQMKKFIQLCQEKGIKMGLISHVYTVCESFKKIQWVEENYGITLENYCVSSREMKVLELQAVAVTYNLAPSEILIVDDLMITLSEASAKGFQNMLPTEVINYIENSK